MTSTTASRALVASGALLCAIAAHAQSARADFEKLGLMGTHTLDCSLPVRETNGYIIYRAVTGPTTRMFVSVAGTASSTAPFRLSWCNGQPNQASRAMVIRPVPEPHCWLRNKIDVAAIQRGTLDGLTFAGRVRADAR